MTNKATIDVAVVGYGYWGPNLVRNFDANERCKVIAICDQQQRRLDHAARQAPHALCTNSYEPLLESNAHLIALAVPLAAHFKMAKAALLAGKHVLVEKPLCRTASEAEELEQLARRLGLHVFVDHTFVFTPAVRRIAQEVWAGELGSLLYYDSVRVNLGLFSSDTSVTWDLAPHDLSILDYLLRGTMPVRVQCVEASHLIGHRPNLAYLTLVYADNFIAHVHVSWLAPVKIRQILIGGDRRMLVFDDTDPAEKVRIYDKGVSSPMRDEAVYQALVQYRIGDMRAPFVSNDEALAIEVENIAATLLDGASPAAGLDAGRRVVRILEAAAASVLQDGAPIRLDTVAEQSIGSVAADGGATHIRDATAS